MSVAAFEGKVLAGNCDIHRREPADVRHTGVLGIAILAEWRGAGLGRAMLKAALSRAARRGIWLVELDVFADNARAIGLYEDLGFRKSGITPNKILRDGKARDELHMFIDLRGTDKSTPTARTKR